MGRWLDNALPAPLSAAGNVRQWRDENRVTGRGVRDSIRAMLSNALCGGYSRTQPLIDGRVLPKGVELTPPLPSGETFWRMVNHGEFDASEMSPLPVRSCARKATRASSPSRSSRHACFATPLSTWGPSPASSDPRS